MKNKLLNWTIILIGGIMIVNLVRSTYDLLQRNKLVADAQERVAIAEKKNAELREQYRIAQRDEFVEKIARDKLGMSREGETVIVLPNGIGSSPPAGEAGKLDIKNSDNAKERDALPVWREWADLFL